MRKISYKSFFLSIAILAILVLPAIGNAATPKTLDVGLEPAKNIGLGTNDLRDTIASIINVAITLLGTVAIVIILYGGFKWMTAGGEEENVTKARKLIINGIIGLVIILASYAITAFVLDSLLSGTGANIT